MIEAATPIPAGEHQVRMEFAYDGGGRQRRRRHALHRRQEVGEGRSKRHFRPSSLRTTAAMSVRTPALQSLPDYGPHGNAFNGKVKGVQLAIAEAAKDVDHLIDAGDRHPRRHGAAVRRFSQGRTARSRQPLMRSAIGRHIEIAPALAHVRFTFGPLASAMFRASPAGPPTSHATFHQTESPDCVGPARRPSRRPSWRPQ